MGDPNTGEIYEGALRDPGDVALNEKQAELLRSLPLRDRINELQSLKRASETNVIQSDEATQTPPPPGELTSTAQLSFSDAVEGALKTRNVKLRCHDCGIVGMAGFLIHPAPIVSPTLVNGQIVLSAGLVCSKCGGMKLFNLNLLGIAMQQAEPSRVITPDQIRQQAPPLVMP